MIGQNQNTIKLNNRCQVLKQIACKGPISRTELAASTGLTKATSGNIVNELINNRIVAEDYPDTDNQNKVGRPSKLLSVSREAPLICGILIKRRFYTICIASLSGSMQYTETYDFPPGLTSSTLLRLLLDSFITASSNYPGRILGIGIACIGPVDMIEGEILEPPNFYGINHVDICGFFRKETGLPCYLISDSSSGALAEKTYGSARNMPNYVYLHIMDGIGSGYILNDSLYNGDRGIVGEIGHTTINHAGPRCACGNIGCLELYANTTRMESTIRNLEDDYHKKADNLIPTGQGGELTFPDIIQAANKESVFAIIALEEFCDYLASALVNIINILNVNHIIIGYDGISGENSFERILQEKIRKRILAKQDNIVIRRSIFQGNAPLIGSIALIANKIFDGSINF